MANRVEPGKRPRLSTSPTFILDRDTQAARPGLGRQVARIIGDTLQGGDRPLDWNMSMQDAIAQPRA